jgi:hypothetical protein
MSTSAVRRSLFALAFACLRTNGVALASVRSEKTDEQGLAQVGDAEHDSEVTAFKVDAEMQHLVKQLLKRNGKDLPSHQEMIKIGLQKVDPKAAAERIEGKLPADVASLVRTSVQARKDRSQPPFS